MKSIDIKVIVKFLQSNSLKMMGELKVGCME